MANQLLYFFLFLLTYEGLWDNWKFPELVSDLFSPAFLSGLEKDDNLEGASKASSASAATNVTGPTDLPGAIATPDDILQRSENLAVRRNAARVRFFKFVLFV